MFHVLFSFFLLFWKQRTVIFQLSGSYCSSIYQYGCFCFYELKLPSLGVLIRRTLLLGVCIGASDFGNSQDIFRYRMPWLYYIFCFAVSQKRKAADKQKHAEVIKAATELTGNRRDKRGARHQSCRLQVLLPQSPARAGSLSRRPRPLEERRRTLSPSIKVHCTEREWWRPCRKRNWRQDGLDFVRCFNSLVLV